MSNNFVENPRGSGPKIPAPRSFVTPAPGMDKGKASGGDVINQADAAPGGLYANATPANNPKVDAGNPIGVGSIGNSRKPYTVR